MSKIAFIGGTGVYDAGIFSHVTSHVIGTPYGQAAYTSGFYDGREMIFMARHGVRHTIPPHKINFRANIYALKKLGVSAIVSTTAVGSLNPRYRTGELVLCDQFIDMTKSRENTFFDGEHYGVAHLDMTEPFCGELRAAVAEAGMAAGVLLHPYGTYVCTEGPRFETPAEIRAYRMWGADVVGMTCVPECVLAREAEMCYATVSMVTNMAAGISADPLTHQEVVDCMKKNVQSFRSLISVLAKNYDPDRACGCHDALAAFGGFHV